MNTTHKFKDVHLHNRLHSNFEENEQFEESSYIICIYTVICKIMKICYEQLF